MNIMIVAPWMMWAFYTGIALWIALGIDIAVSGIWLIISFAWSRWIRRRNRRWVETLRSKNPELTR